MKKIISGFLISSVILLIVTLGKLEFLLSSKILILFIMGIVANYYQPDYHPFKFKNNDVDRGTVLQILWTVYLTQLLALLEALYLNYPSSLEWSPASVIFLVVAVLGLVFRSWAYLHLGKFFTMHLETQSDHAVIDDGPYTYVRHPSYTGACLTYVFSPLFLGSYYSALITVLFLAFAYHRRISFEENMLLEKLGSAYGAFCSTRKRLFPGIW